MFMKIDVMCQLGKELNFHFNMLMFSKALTDKKDVPSLECN